MVSGRTRWQSVCISGIANTGRGYEGEGQEELLDDKGMLLPMEIKKMNE